jgi:hypothetical protein
MEEIENDQVLDAGMISSAQAVEHYEICRYGTLIEHAYPHSSGGFLCDMRTNPELEHDAAEPQRLVA